jgi:hypothetical protein
MWFSCFQRVTIEKTINSNILQYNFFYHAHSPMFQNNWSSDHWGGVRVGGGGRSKSDLILGRFVFVFPRQFLETTNAVV